MSMRQTVEADVTRLRKLLDDTNVTRMHLEGDIESLKEELIMLKKNHMAVRRFLCWRKPPLGPVQLRAPPKKNGCVARHSPDRFPSQQDLAELRAQISSMGVHVDVDAPKGHDLAKIMEEMREKYERIALKNQQELKLWHDSQVGLEVGC